MKSVWDHSSTSVLVPAACRNGLSTFFYFWQMLHRKANLQCPFAQQHGQCKAAPSLAPKTSWRCCWSQDSTLWRDWLPSKSCSTMWPPAWQPSGMHLLHRRLDDFAGHQQLFSQTIQTSLQRCCAGLCLHVSSTLFTSSCLFQRNILICMQATTL